MPRRPRVLFALLCAALVPTARGSAQDTTEAAARPYSTVTVGITAGSALHDGALSDFWESGRAMRLDVYTRFHVGEVGGYLMTLPYTSRSGAEPDFRTYLIGLDWRFTPRVTRWLRASASITAGDYLTTFERIETKGLGKESEIFVGASAGLALDLTRVTALTATLSAINVFTSTPIRSAFATVGLSHTMETPRWLRGVFE